jgi:AcrR family transcriptional regulator
MTDSTAEADVPLAERAVQRRLAERQQLAAGEVNRLLDAALQLMTDDPSRPPRVSDVVRTAGVTNQVFYRSFDSRDDLLAAVVDNGARRLVTYVHRLMSQAEDAGSRLRVFVDAVLSQAIDPVATMTRAVLSGTVRQGDQAARARVWVADRLAAVLSPELAALGSADPARDSRALTHAVLGTMEHFLWQQQRPGADDMEHLCALLLSTVTTQARGNSPARS